MTSAFLRRILVSRHAQVAAALSVVGFSLLMAPPLRSQSITTGAVTGTITDATGAVIAKASVILTSNATNVASRSTTNSDGTYRFAFVQPGTYKLDVTASGFQPQQNPNVVVTAGEPATVNMQLAVASATTEVTVTESNQGIQTQNADVSTTVSREQIESLPNPGNDLTYYAQTAPGVVMNTQAGYGNLSSNGLPGISNLFTINGQNYNDPFLGLNNSGASNLLLGQNDISEATVLTTPYSGQYGQYAGAQVAYITKSGTNDFHANAIYNWNGRALNANQFFANSAGLPTPFNNFNQWAVGAQGPIWKNHTFFDVDYEGLHNLLPTAANENLIPSPQFQAATLANLAGDGNSAELPFYKQIFGVYNGAPGAGSAIPVVGGGCGGLTFTGLAASAPCALEFRSTPPNLNTEYQWSARVDHNISERDRFYVRVLRDSGFQPTFTSPFGSTFNAQSNQPQMSGQFAENHTFGPNTVNQLSGSVLFYSALFQVSNGPAALAALPTFLVVSGGAFSQIGAYGEPGGFFFPNGRRVFQYQVLDDFSHVMGNHTLRAGVSWLHDTVTDLDFSSIAGPIYGAITTNLSDFFNGGGVNSSIEQAFPSTTEEGLAFNTLGGYIADDWKVRPNLTVSLNMRFEHYANPTCQANCFSQLSNQFTGYANYGAANVPYNQLIESGLRNAYVSTQALVYEPRIGLAYTPTRSGKTVIRLGAGVFGDQLPGGLAEDAAFNAPNLNSFTIGGLSNATIAPGVPNSLFTAAAQANQALVTDFRSGGSFNSISAAVPSFSAPTFFNFPRNFAQPTYYKWNFEVQQDLGHNFVLDLNYNGNHGTHIPVDDAGLNAYCPTSICPGGFLGLPTQPSNPAFGQVQQYLSAGTSSYNGLTVSLRKQLSHGLLFSVNYTWSHALDDVSNGGIGNEPFGILATNETIQFAQNPYNIRENWGNSDYDVRHYVNANLVLSDSFRHAGMKWGPNAVFGGWTFSTNWFWRTGLPFTVIDNADLGTLLGLNYDGSIFATPTGSVYHSCTSEVNSPCLSASSFLAAGSLSGFGAGSRNQYFGPHFFDVDMSLMKDVRIRERLTFQFGVQAFNVFNHTNFDQPVADIANPNFGLSIAAVGPPTSLLGSFVGAGSSPRFVEVKGQLRF